MACAPTYGSTQSNPTLHFVAQSYDPQSPFPPPPPHVSFRLSVNMSGLGATVCGHSFPAAQPRP